MAQRLRDALAVFPPEAPGASRILIEQSLKRTKAFRRICEEGA
jgi:hypothetical protein